MRITATRLIDLAATATTQQQAKVASAAAQVSTGLRVTTPSDDPVAWVAAQRTKLRAALSQGAGAAVATSRDRLITTDTALGSLGDVIAQVRTLAIQASSASYGGADRVALAGQVRGLFASALAAANVQGADGEYLLAGAASLTAPFTAAGAYVGDAATRAVPADGGTTTAVSIAGNVLTAARGVDVLPLVDRVATALDGEDEIALVNNADRAMYEAKAAGKGIYRIFEEQMTVRASRRAGEAFPEGGCRTAEDSPSGASRRRAERARAARRSRALPHRDGVRRRHHRSGEDRARRRYLRASAAGPGAPD